jgi:hypothetical protein
MRVRSGGCGAGKGDWPREGVVWRDGSAGLVSGRAREGLWLRSGSDGVGCLTVSDAPVGSGMGQLCLCLCWR